MAGVTLALGAQRALLVASAVIEGFGATSGLSRQVSACAQREHHDLALTVRAGVLQALSWLSRIAHLCTACGLWLLAAVKWLENAPGTGRYSAFNTAPETTLMLVATTGAALAAWCVLSASLRLLNRRGVR